MCKFRPLVNLAALCWAGNSSSQSHAKRGPSHAMDWTQLHVMWGYLRRGDVMSDTPVCFLCIKWAYSSAPCWHYIKIITIFSYNLLWGEVKAEGNVIKSEICIPPEAAKTGDLIHLWCNNADSLLTYPVPTSQAKHLSPAVWQWPSGP